MRRRTHTHGRTERGASAVEFALVVPILLLILGGIFNFGLAFSQKLALDNAVRETARLAAVDTGRTSGDLQAAGVTTFNNSSIARQGNNAVLVVGSCNDTAFATPVVATGTFRSKFMFPWLLPGIPNQIDWNSRGEYICEYS